MSIFFPIQISFDEYSPEECQETWRHIQNKIRCYRILKEILHDAREYVNQNDPFTHVYNSIFLLYLL